MITLELKHIAPYLPYRLKCQYLGIIDVEAYEKCSFNDPFDSEEETGYGLKVAELKEIKIFKEYWKVYIGTYHAHLKSFINGNDFKPLLIQLSDIILPIYSEIRDEFSDIEIETLFDSLNFTRLGLISHETVCNKLNFEGVQKLFANHFDVYNLIPQELAINKSIIK